MDSLSPQVVSTAKLTILNPNEFDLWKMRIEQYFLMTDYSFWEVILNGDSPVPIRIVEGVLQPVAPTTAEQKLARKNELKARESLDQIHDRLQKLVSQLEIHGVSLSQEDVNLKFLRSLPSEWKTHTLLWRNKADLEEQSLDDLFNSLKIYEAEVKHSFSTGTTTQNLAFVSSSNTDCTTESLSAAASVSAICAKMHVSSLPNVDSLSNVIDVDELEEMDLRWQMAMLTMRARRFLQKTSKNLGANRPTSMGFDMSKVECYNCHRKGHFARECRSLKDSRRNEAAEPQRRTVPVETSTSNTLVSQCDGVGSYDCRTFMPPKPDLVFNTAATAVEIDHHAFTVQLSPTKPPQDLSHTNRPTTPIIEDWVSDSEDESKTKAPQIIPSFVQSSKQVKSPRHSIQHVEITIPTTTPKPASPKFASSGKRRNRKACFVCKSMDHLIKDCYYHAKNIAQPTTRNHAHRVTHKHYAQMTPHNPQKHMVPAAVLTQSKPVSIITVRPVSAAVPKSRVTQPRHAKPFVTKSKSPIIRHLTRSQSPKTNNLPPRVTAVPASVVSAAQGIKGKWKWRPKCLILDHVSLTTSASMTLKRFDYNDALGRSKSVIACVRN
nr:hypothetical protein [Tanacetum cinerariifolium]